MVVTVTPLSATIGVEVTGLSGDGLVDRGVADDCLASVEEHGVVVYRGADLDDDQLVGPSPAPERRASCEQVPAREHPLVWTRRNGRQSLLLGATAGAVVGVPADEGRALLDRLLDWATQPQFVLRHRWRRGDLVVWDNTGLLHRALPYASDSPRLMHRTTIAGQEEIA